jgi:hypothetical protein
MWVCVCVGTAAGQSEKLPAASPPDSLPRAELTVEEIGAAIVDLGHDDFAVREAATKKLGKAGVAAVKPLAAAAEHEDLEVAIRAVRVLDAMFRADDDVANEAAEREIERLAKSKSAVIAERSRGTLESLTAVREQRAIRALVRMGAEVELTQDFGRNPQRGFLMGQRDIGQKRNVLLNEDWKGGDDGLEQIRKITDLNAIYITPGAKVSAEAFDRLERDVPNRVQRRGSGMLGIMADASPDGCVITGITEGGPADEAGLELQDLILLYDDEGVTDFDQVIKKTFEFPPGRVIEVTVLRSGEILRIPVKLAKFSLKPRRAQPEPEGRGR